MCEQVHAPTHTDIQTEGTKLLTSSPLAHSGAGKTKSVMTVRMLAAVSASILAWFPRLSVASPPKLPVSPSVAFEIAGWAAADAMAGAPELALSACWLVLISYGDVSVGSCAHSLTSV